MAETHSGDKCYKIDISNLGPTGLFNQLINIINGLIIGHYTNRLIYEPRFLPNYDSLDAIPVSDIIDIEYLNEVLQQLNLNVRIITSIGLNQWIISEFYNKLTSPIVNTSISTICDKLVREQHCYLNIGSVFGILIGHDRSIELNIYKNLRFNPKFYEILSFCLEKYLSGSYNVIHLRLEDDWIDFMRRYPNMSFESYTRHLLNQYYQAMTRLFLPNDKIYLATHLTKAEYRNNSIISEIRTRYPNVVIGLNWREQFPNILKGREIDALVDFLISSHGEKFIGIYSSTYSRIIGDINRANGKIVEILKC